MIDQAWSIVFAERAVIWLVRSAIQNMSPHRPTVVPVEAGLDRVMVLRQLQLERLLEPFASGRAFGPAGEYEQLLGKATFAIDPRHASNRSIVDLDLAPQDAAGRVCFQADVRILKPADASRANRRLVLDVVNRGNPVAIRNTDLGVPRTPEPESQGWLLQQGYTIVSCGWQHNVPAQ